MPLPYLALLRRFWPAIPIGALAILLLFSHLSSRHKDKVIAQQAAAIQMADAKLAISNASIDALTHALDAKNAESTARAKALDDARTASAADLVRLDQLQRQDAGRIATLKRLASNLSDTPGCKAPDALIANLGGL